MGNHNYGSFEADQQKDLKEARQAVHPIWRGVGLILIFLTPIMGYFGALAILDQNKKMNWFQIPPEYLASGADPLLYVKIVLTILVGLFFYFFLQFITFLLYRLFGPSRYGIYDVPSVSYKSKRRGR